MYCNIKSRPGLLLKTMLASLRIISTLSRSFRVYTARPHDSGITLTDHSRATELSEIAAEGTTQKTLVRYLEAELAKWIAQNESVSVTNWALIVSTAGGCAADARDYIERLFNTAFEYASPLRFPKTTNSSLLGAASKTLNILGESLLTSGESGLFMADTILKDEPSLLGCVCIEVDNIGSREEQEMSLLMLRTRLAKTKVDTSITCHASLWSSAIQPMLDYIKTYLGHADETCARSVWIYAADELESRTMHDLYAVCSVIPSAEVLLVSLRKGDITSATLTSRLVSLATKISSPGRRVAIICNSGGRFDFLSVT